MTEVTAICRFCHATCGLVATLEDGRITKLIGDLDNPMYTGYSCIKGRNYHEFHASPDRILKPLRRNAQGDFESVASGEALAEIGRLRHDSRSGEEFARAREAFLNKEPSPFGEG